MELCFGISVGTLMLMTRMLYVSWINIGQECST